LLEVAYRAATKPELGGKMVLFWMPLDAYQPWPWALGVGLSAIGFYAFRRTWPLVARCWEAASAPLRAPE